MSAIDSLSIKHFGIPEHFAELINNTLGRNLIADASKLEERTGTVFTLAYGKMSRDLLRFYPVEIDGRQYSILFGVEIQADIKYEEAIKIVVYAILDQWDRVKALGIQHKNDKSNKIITSYMQEGDVITPVISQVLYLGLNQWNAPRSLKELYGEMDPWLSELLMDAKLQIISPLEMSDDEIRKYQSSTRELFFCITLIS